MFLIIARINSTHIQSTRNWWFILQVWLWLIKQYKELHAVIIPLDVVILVLSISDRGIICDEWPGPDSGSIKVFVHQGPFYTFTFTSPHTSTHFTTFFIEVLTTCMLKSHTRSYHTAFEFTLCISYFWYRVYLPYPFLKTRKHIENIPIVCVHVHVLVNPI